MKFTEIFVKNDRIRRKAVSRPSNCPALVLTRRNAPRILRDAALHLAISGPNFSSMDCGMSRLDDAQKRLESALTRLESVAGSQTVTAENTALEVVQAENETLRNANNIVTQRLDLTIERLRRLVDE
jgi:hypothetical protein